MPLRISRAAGAWVGIDLIEERRIVREIKKTRKGKQRPRTSVEIVVVHLFTIFTAQFQRVITGYFAKDVTELQRLL